MQTLVMENGQKVDMNYKQETKFALQMEQTLQPHSLGDSNNNGSERSSSVIGVNQQEIQILRREQPTTQFKRLKDVENKIPSGFSLFRNESVGSFTFDLMNDSKILKLIREKKQPLHLHEIISQFSKIFFDIDLKIPSEFLNNELIINYLQKTNRITNIHELEIDDISEILNIKDKQGTIVERIIIYTIQQQIAKHFASTFSEIEEENWILNNMQDALFLDTLFDKFRSSRQIQQKSGTQEEQYTKISWHLTFLPDMYYMKINELKELSSIINQNIDKFWLNTLEKLNNQLKVNTLEPMNIKDCIDIQVYRKNGSIRFVNCSKLQQKEGVKTFIEIGQNKFNNPQFSEQLPSRFLVSRLLTQQGNPLKLLILHSKNIEGVVPEMSSAVDFSSCPLSIKEIQKLLSKQNIFNVTMDTPLQQGDIFHIRIKNHLRSCILCNRIHDSDNMYLIINSKLQSVEIRCFRQKGVKGLKLDYNGQLLITEFDVCDLNKNIPNMVENNEVNQQDDVELSGLGIIKQIKRDQLAKLNTNYYEKHEQLDFGQWNIVQTEANTDDLQAFPENFSKLYIKSNMGTGKTKRLLSYIANYIQKYPQNVIYILSFRITFAEDLTNKLNTYLQNELPQNQKAKFVSYLQLHKQRTINEQYLVIQIESLNKVNPNLNKCNLLILDESESIFEQLTSGLSQKESINFSIFTQLVKNSQQIICMDAFMSSRTISLMELYSKNNHNEDKQQSLYIQNTWQREKKYILYQSNKKQDLWLADLIHAYKQGDNIVVPCNNATVAETVYKLLKSIVPEEDSRYIQIYTQKLNREQKEKDLLDLQKSWNEYKILIYSPTISAGVSYEMPHFNRIFAYFDIRSTNMETFFQMMGRVRNISSNTYHILLSGFPIQNPCVISQIHNSIVQQIQDACQQIPLGVYFSYNKDIISVQNDDYYQLVLHNMRIKNLTTSSTTQRFLYLAGNNAIIQTKSPKQGVEYEYKLNDLVNDLKQWKFEQMRDAKLYTQIDQLQQTQNENYQFEKDKFYIVKDMGLSKETSHYLESMTKRNQMDQWIRKYRYLMFRMQYGQFKDYIKCQKQQMQAPQFNQYEKMDIIRELLENSKERFLEIILQIIGLNQDLLDVRVCAKHKQQVIEQLKQYEPSLGYGELLDNIDTQNCNCNRQIISNMHSNIVQFLLNQQQVISFCKYVKHIQLHTHEKIKRILIRAQQYVKNETTKELAITMTIKLLRYLLNNQFGIQLANTQKHFVIMKHANKFDEFMVITFGQNKQYSNKFNFLTQKIICQYMAQNEIILKFAKQSSFLEYYEQSIQKSKIQNINIWTDKDIIMFIKQLDGIVNLGNLTNLLVYYKEYDKYQEIVQLLYLVGLVHTKPINKTTQYYSLIQDYNYQDNSVDLVTNIKNSIQKINEDCITLKGK